MGSRGEAIATGHSTAETLVSFHYRSVTSPQADCLRAPPGAARDIRENLSQNRKNDCTGRADVLYLTC